jgi:hypothetical protein
MVEKKQTLKPIQARIYSYWQALYMAFYSHRLYVDVAKRWKGLGLLYLLLLMAVILIPFSIRVMVIFNQYFDEQIIFPIESLPPLSVVNGNVIFNQPMPYLIENKHAEVIGMIDTESTMTKIDEVYPHLVIQITKNQLYFRPGDVSWFQSSTLPGIKNDLLIYTFHKEDTSFFNAKDWVHDSHLRLLKWFIILMIYPSVTAFVFGLLLSFMMIIAMLMQVFSWLILKTKLPYAVSLRLFIVSSTPQLSLFMILLSLDYVFSGLGLFCIGLWAVYFTFAVLSYRRERQTMVLL